jgi:hypothetical protein
VLAADQFVIRPSGRREDVARARAAGGDVRSIIAGYHWFTDWGRDTMISLDGLTCVTGRHAEAGYILRTFGQYVRDGLIPNMFPDGSNEGLYHTADASLWFFHAVDRYLKATGDAAILAALLPKLADIVRCHLEGTRFGIHVDPKDGLLIQGADGYQLTWMDAKCDGWVVTPRRGKAVEINALWYNALRLLEGWTRESGDEKAASALATHADLCRRSFNERFWNAAAGYLFDVVESSDLAGQDDSACRPNQLLAISLSHPVLDESRWAPVVETARAKLLTPVGLRSLSPDHPDFKPTDRRDLRTRDAAYHQGTVWAWLIGPFIDAWLKVHPEDHAGARRFSTASCRIWTRPASARSARSSTPSSRTPRGCVAQAWSVAEVLRSWVRTSPPSEALARREFERSSGVLLHPTSLPGPFGIGDFGGEARRFVDFIAAAGQTFWQIMPLTSPGYGDSPYASTSAFAGNVNLISPEALVTMGLLDEADIDHPPAFSADLTDHGQVIAYKSGLLEKAFHHFKGRVQGDRSSRATMSACSPSPRRGSTTTRCSRPSRSVTRGGVVDLGAGARPARGVPWPMRGATSAIG